MWWRAQEEQANRRGGCNTSSKMMPPVASRKEQGRTRLGVPRSGDGPAMLRRRVASTGRAGVGILVATRPRTLVLPPLQL